MPKFINTGERILTAANDFIFYHRYDSLMSLCWPFVENVSLTSCLHIQQNDDGDSLSATGWNKPVAINVQRPFTSQLLPCTDCPGLCQPSDIWRQRKWESVGKFVCTTVETVTYLLNMDSGRLDSRLLIIFVKYMWHIAWKMKNSQHLDLWPTKAGFILRILSFLSTIPMKRLKPC